MKTLRWISVLSFTLLLQFAHAAKPLATAFQLLDKADQQALLQLPAETLKSARNEFGESVLIRAIVTEKYEIAKALLKAKMADVTVIDQNRNDALLYAVGQGQFEIVQLLIDQGAILDRSYGEDKENIAFEAARMGDEKMLTLLGKAGPQLLSGVNKKGQGLIEVAVDAAQTKTALTLVKNPEVKNAITLKRKSVLRKLLSKDPKNPRAQELLKHL